MPDFANLLVRRLPERARVGRDVARSVHRYAQPLGQVADVARLVLVTRAEDDDVPAVDHRHRAHRRDQLGPTHAEQPGHRHVRGLTGRRRAVVVDVDMPVGISKSHAAEDVTGGRGGCTHEDRAAAAEQQRPRTGSHHFPNSRTDFAHRRADTRPADDAAARVAVGADDPHGQVTRVGRIQPANEAVVAHRLRRELGAEQRAARGCRDAVDGHAERRPGVVVGHEPPFRRVKDQLPRRIMYEPPAARVVR